MLSMRFKQNKQFPVIFLGIFSVKKTSKQKTPTKPTKPPKNSKTFLISSEVSLFQDIYGLNLTHIL